MVMEMDSVITGRQLTLLSGRYNDLSLLEKLHFATPVHSKSMEEKLNRHGPRDGASYAFLDSWLWIAIGFSDDGLKLQASLRLDSFMQPDLTGSINRKWVWSKLKRLCLFVCLLN